MYRLLLRTNHNLSQRLPTAFPPSGRFWSSSEHGPPAKDGDNPFDVLGIPKHSSFDLAKKKFIELAKQLHPDTAVKTASNEADKDVTAEFVRLREAFESIRQNHQDVNKSNSRGKGSWSDAEFQAWYHEQTGHADILFKMDISTRQEVIDVGENMAQGGLDKGGMWELARQMSQQKDQMMNSKARNRGDEPIGIGKPEEPEKTHRRRRRRS